MKSSASMLGENNNNNRHRIDMKYSLYAYQYAKALNSDQTIIVAALNLQVTVAVLYCTMTILD